MSSLGQGPRLATYDLTESDRYLFYNPASAACLVTDSRGRDVVRRHLEGLQSERPEKGAPHPFVTKISPTGIFKVVGVEPGYGLVPQRLIVELTSACNLRCKTCYMSAAKPAAGEMTTAEVTSLLADALANGTETVAFIGGEPMMRRDLGSLVDFALAGFAEVMISTNGTLMEEAFLARYDGSRNLTLQVSLDGPDAASHDAIRGKGSFAKASAALDLARKHGIKTMVSSVLNRHNYNLVAGTCDFAARKGSVMAIFHKVHVFGRAQGCPEILPSKDQLMHSMGVLLEKFDQYETRGRMIVDFPHNRCFRGDSSLDCAFLGCHFGRASAYVTSDGGLACCSHLRDGDYMCGSIRDRPLVDIWRTSAMLEKMRSMTVDDLPSCRACQIKYMCRGSCRADALGHSGSLTGDPYDCEALKAYYTYVLDYYARNLKPVVP